MPLVKCGPGDERRLQELLAREPYFNLFIIANLGEGLGPNVEAWEQPGVGVLHRRGRNWVVDAGPRPEVFDAADAGRIMASYPPPLVETLLGQSPGVATVYDRLEGYRGTVYDQDFAVLREKPAPIPYVGTPRRARPADLDALTAVYANAEDLSRPRAAVESQLPATWLVEDSNAITSVACFSAQTDHAAMIGGVVTPPEHRRKGYASTMIHAMATWMLSQGKAPCLFYHNPEARRVYLRLGFQEIGPWRMVHFARDH